MSRTSVLIVDDHEAFRRTLRMRFEAMPEFVVCAEAADGVEAVETARKFHPNVVFLDLGMPKMNGYDAARMIRQQPECENVKLIALTGWGQEEDKRRSHEAGFDLHMVKPIEPTTLEKELIARGIAEPVARQLAADHDEAKIRLQLEIFDALPKKKRDKIEDAAAWLVSAIKAEHGYAAPKGFKTQAQRQRDDQARAAQHRQDIEASRRKQEESARERDRCRGCLLPTASLRASSPGYGRRSGCGRRGRPSCRR